MAGSEKSVQPKCDWSKGLLCKIVIVLQRASGARAGPQEIKMHQSPSGWPNLWCNVGEPARHGAAREVLASCSKPAEGLGALGRSKRFEHGGAQLGGKKWDGRELWVEACSTVLAGCKEHPLLEFLAEGEVGGLGEPGGSAEKTGEAGIMDLRQERCERRAAKREVGAAAVESVGGNGVTELAEFSSVEAVGLGRRGPKRSRAANGRACAHEMQKS